uniref:aspartate carbamoyltransferase n=2 Tax=Hirondellea gigas TaxID=1518452 RepID=A0A6A7G6L7_9CRUS
MRGLRYSLTSSDGSLTGRHPLQDLLKGFVLASIFYEPSTRTSSSFEAAMYRLGGKVVSISDVKSSSVSKGETLEDTVRTLQSYCDILVLRHPEVGAAIKAAKVLKIPLLNAGDGAGEHPTQALLDAYTIRSELGRLGNLRVALAGDLRHGRTVHSLARLLDLFEVRMDFVSPDTLSMPESVLNDLISDDYEIHRTLETVLDKADVIYMTRIQKERFDDLKHYEEVQNSFCISPELMNLAKPKMIVMHPLPRVTEIDPRFDADPRAAYFRQMENGLFVRMALLAMTLGKA